MRLQHHLLQSEFCVAGRAWETCDTPGLVESRDHWKDYTNIKEHSIVS